MGPTVRTPTRSPFAAATFDAAFRNESIVRSTKSECEKRREDGEGE